MTGQCQTCDITSCQYRCSSENADAETIGTAVTLRLLSSFSFSPRALPHLNTTPLPVKMDLLGLQTLARAFLLVSLLLLAASLWLIIQSAGTFRTTTHFGAAPGSCLHPHSVRLIMIKTLICFRLSHGHHPSSSSSSPSLSSFHANRKSLPHLTHTHTHSPFLFSADASGSKIRQQLWLMCGCNMADSDH